MKLFAANIKTVTVRFLLMMLVIIIGGFSGQYWLVAFGLPIFLSALLAVEFDMGGMKREQSIMKLNTPRSAANAKSAA